MIEDPVLWYKIQQRVGFNQDSLRCIGTGYHGAAYDLEDGRVLKLSHDRSDAYGSLMFMRKPSELVVDIEDVFSYQEAIGADYKFAIVTRKLRPLTSDWLEFFKACAYVSFSGKPPEVYDGVIKNFTKIQFRKFNKKLDWLESLVREFNDRQFNWNDFHVGNFMREGRHKVKVIDLGHGCPLQKPPVPRFK